MESGIKISYLNDFIFCPRSIYFHNLYYDIDENLYHSSYQKKGKLTHSNIDNKTYSSKKSIIQGIDIYSSKLGVYGKIDLFDMSEKKLIERKKKIKKLFEGHYLQLFAQYYCLLEMGYKVEKIVVISLEDNRKFNLNLPKKENEKRLKEVIEMIKNFNLRDKNFSQNINKCRKCIYKELCDYYKND